MKKHGKSAGFTLIEALVALLVLTVGLLGSAAMILTSVKNSHNSYLRTQASFIADGLIERMRANQEGVARGLYTGALDSSVADAGACGASGCSPADVATRDRFAVAQQILQHMPFGSGSVACNVAAGVIGGSGRGVQPTNGTCTIVISWTEKRDVDDDGGAGAQRFELVVQP